MMPYLCSQHRSPLSVVLWVIIGSFAISWVPVVETFVPSGSICGGWKQATHPKDLPVSGRWSSPSVFGDDNDKGQDDDDDDENSSSPGRLRRKRDLIKEWMSSGKTNKSPMVRPIRMEDGSVEEEVAPSRGRASRLKANFDDIFAGMPSMQEILGDNQDATNDDQSNNKRRSQRDESWFEEEKKEIEANYRNMYNEMVATVEEQRREDPESVPSNAEAMIEDVLKQEMMTEIEATKEMRAQENLTNYGNEQKEAVEARDMDGVTSERVDNLLAEDKIAQEQADAIQGRVDAYRRYELEAFLKNQNGGGRTGPQVPEPNTDLDQWALQRLQDMVDARQDDSDLMVTDIIEDSLEDLRDRIEQETERKSRIQPETLKEWQMYRAISTRLGLQSTKLDEIDEIVSEERIAAQLQSWKDYIDKEDIIREKSGLSRGPKLPFEWQESSRDKEIEEAQNKAALKMQEGKSKVEIRKEVNRRSIEALETLLKTSDPIRGERLRKDIDALKQELEANDYLDVDQSLLEEGSEDELGPVDISDIFSKDGDRMSSFNDNYVPPSSFNPPSFEDVDTSGNMPLPNRPFYGAEDSVDNDPQKPPAPPTPFFSQDNDDEDAPAVPDTPFFSPEADSMDGTGETKYKLGTIDEQKLRSMYQRAGARTDEEKAAIREQWESFQEFEKSRRDQSGLTDGNDSELMNRADIGYDLSDVTTEGGDFDAAKILASIGPRPSRKRKADEMTASSSTTEGGPSTAEDESPPTASDLDAEEVADSLYRAVSAVGGGRTKDDPAAKAQEKAAFSEFINKENEMRQSLDNLDEDIASKMPGAEDDFDDESYAEDALSSLGPRPSLKRRRISEKEYSDRSIALSNDDDDDTDDEEDNTSATSSESSDFSAPEDDLVPGWLRKEREASRKRGESPGGRGNFLGSDMDDVFDDDEYEHNMRQLAEYERRRGGGKKQIGIDISDVLGRSSDDYADYNYDDNYFRAKKTGWGTSGFVARKENLLDYIELSVMELNSLMDHKDSVHSTGVSQYLPRINKPFKEFGAIFRLEGVLIDTTGMQYEAWTKVAEKIGFRKPSLEEVRRASVLRSDIAIREAFFWTDDLMLCREAAAAHEQVLGEVFDEWTKDKSFSSKKQPAEIESDKGSLAMGEESVPTQPAVEPKLDMSEGEKLKLLTDAWSRTAITHRLASPSRYQVEMASVLSPDIAVRQAFQWSSDRSEIETYAATYRAILQDLLGTSPASKQVHRKVNTKPEASQPKRVLDQNAMMELEYKAWSKLAEDNGFEMPLPEEVMAAVVINDPEIAIRDGFGWTEDASLIPNLVASYKKSMNALKEEYTGVASTPEIAQATEISAKAEETPVNNNDNDNGPTQEELFQMQHHAWRSAALNHSFQLPPIDQLQVASGMSPAEAVTRLFGWTSDESIVKAVCATFNSALKDISQKYIQKYKLPPGTNLFPEQGKDRASASSPKVVANDEDVVQAVYDAWMAVAKKNNFPLPDEEQVLFALSVGPEEAVISGFEWANDAASTAKVVDDYKAEFQKWRAKQGKTAASGEQNTEKKDEALPFFSAIPGADTWLQSLLDVDMQIAVVSNLNRQQLDILLEASGLSHLFDADKRVTANNNYEREMDQLLGASLRLERRPDHCVVFGASPNSATAALDVEMRSVGVIGAFPRYDLLTADSTASSFDDLTAMNIRRLFGERVYDQPMVDMQQADPERITRTKTKFFWDDD